MSVTDLASLSYNGVTVPFDGRCSYKEVPDLDKSVGRVGTKAAASVEAYVIGSTPAELDGLLAAARAAFAVSGSALVVKGLGGVTLFELLGPRCLGGGPHLEVEASPHPTTPLRVDLRVTATADKLDDEGGGGDGGDGGGPADRVKDSFAIEYVKKLDGLRQVIRTGVLNGVNTGAHYVTVLLPAWERGFPGHLWLTEGTYKLLGEGLFLSKLEYTLRAEELAARLPGDVGTTPRAVEGEYSESTSLDEQFRKVTVYTHDYLVDGPISAMLTLIRPPPGRTIFREEFEFSTIKERRLRARFEFLDSADADVRTAFLLNYTYSQSIRGGNRFGGVPDVWEEKTYDGFTDPVFVVRPRQARRMFERGTAVAKERFYQAPAPSFPSQFVEPPEVTKEYVNKVERRTTWTYAMYLKPGQDFVHGRIGRDTDPSFFPATSAT